MSNTKIVDDEEWTQPCNHPEHNPPTHIVIPQGKKMIHTCPKCGEVSTIVSWRRGHGKS